MRQVQTAFVVRIQACVRECVVADGASSAGAPAGVQGEGGAL